MASEKLLAEWFWIDRWIGSSGFLLPMEPRGVYREMLTQAWRRRARLPNDHETIRRAIGATPEEWERCWPVVSGYWRAKNGYLFNATQARIYAQAVALQHARVKSGRRGGLRSQQVRRQANDQANGAANVEANTAAKMKPPSPSPSPYVQEKEERETAILASFDRFKAVYPKPAGDGAWREWQRIAPSDPVAAQIVEGAEAYARHVVDYDAKYIKHAQNWLKDRGWLEPYAVKARRQFQPPAGYLDDWHCPHTPTCSHPTRCATLVEIAATKARSKQVAS